MLKPILSSLLLMSLLAGTTIRTDKKFVYPTGTKAGGNFTPAILTDGTLYISGQAGEDADGKLAVDFEGEVKQSLNNIGAVLKEAGMTPTDVVSVQVYLTDAALFPKMNEVYRSYFNDPRPTRTTVVVAKLVGPGHIEITATARR